MTTRKIETTKPVTEPIPTVIPDHTPFDPDTFFVFDKTDKTTTEKINTEKVATEKVTTEKTTEITIFEPAVNKSTTEQTPEPEITTVVAATTVGMWTVGETTFENTPDPVDETSSESVIIVRDEEQFQITFADFILFCYALHP